jgi:hypothetical protein
MPRNSVPCFQGQKNTKQTEAVQCLHIFWTTSNEILVIELIEGTDIESHCSHRFMCTTEFVSQTDPPTTCYVDMLHLPLITKQILLAVLNTVVRCIRFCTSVVAYAPFRYAILPSSACRDPSLSRSCRR